MRKRPQYLKLINIGIVISIILIEAGYLILTNDLSLKSFVLKDLEKQKSNLEESLQKLEMQEAVLQAYGDLGSKFEKASFVKVDKVEYLEISEDNKVAKLFN